MSGPAGAQPAPRVATNRWGGAALYDTVVAHARQIPVRNAFRYRSYSWLVDLDDLPRVPRPLRVLAQFRAQDHLGSPERSLRENLDAFLAARGVDLGGGRVLMLANARVLGYVFNPLSVYWCHDGDGALVCVVAEVHNTYGERHAYLVRTDAAGQGCFDKEFYVSPFYPVDGHYRMSLPRPDEVVRIAIELHRGESKPFVATVRGRRRPAGTCALLRAAIRVPWVTFTVAVQIRIQGIRLWVRRVRVVPRPEHPRQPEV
ncbi:MAG: DUF1365 domain-containing protein [Sporichthyaceae bacterium]